MATPMERDAKKRLKMLEGYKLAVAQLNVVVPTLTKAQKAQAKQQQKETRNLKANAKALLDSGKAFTRRSAIVKAAAKETGGALNLGIESFRNYKEAGGTTFEYMAMFLSGQSEQLRVFGFEVSSLRRIAFGFLPAGTFRAFNKMATLLNGMGSALRVVRKESTGAKSSLGKQGLFGLFDESDNLFAKARANRQTAKGLLSRGTAPQGSPLSSSYVRGDLDYQMGVTYQNLADKQRLGGIKGYANVATASAFSGLGKTKPKSFAETPLGKAIFGIVKGARLFFSMSFTKLFKMAAGFVIKSAIIFFRFTLLASVALMGLFAAFMILKPALMAAWDFMSAVIGPFLGFIAEGFMDIWDGIQEIYQGFVEGDLFAVIGGVWTIAWGLLQVALAALVGLLAVAFAFIGGLVWGAITGFIDYIFDFSGGIMNNLDKIVVMAAVVLGLIFGFPVVFALAVVTAIGVLLSKIGLFADGGVTGGGVSIVGEKGPELVRLPAGSRVSSAQKTRTMLSSNNSGGNTFNITINAKDTSDGEMRRIADKIGKMINNKINRNVGASSIR